MSIPIPIVDGLIGIGSKLIERIFPNPAERDKARLELVAMQQTGELQELATRMSAIVAEAQSQHWLAANWRPITMLVFVFIVFNNLVVVPYAAAFGWAAAPVLDMPENLWTLIQLGLGGYVVGRSVEKTASVIAGALGQKR